MSNLFIRQNLVKTHHCALSQPKDNVFYRTQQFDCIFQFYSSWKGEIHSPFLYSSILLYQFANGYWFWSFLSQKPPNVFLALFQQNWPILTPQNLSIVLKNHWCKLSKVAEIYMRSSKIAQILMAFFSIEHYFHNIFSLEMSFHFN